MAYRYGNREQMSFLPDCIEDYVGADDPVRAYDAFVDALDLRELGIVLDEYQVGNSEYTPVAMLKLLVYGYSYGFRSSRKLERALHHNLSFIWLVGGLKPDHKTISEFRRRNGDILRKVLKQCARLCLKLGLIEGNTLFVDGTKIKGNASIRHTWTHKQCEAALERIDERIEEILEECNSTDIKESATDSLVRMSDELKEKGEHKKRISSILSEMHRENKTSLNLVDRDCTMVYRGKGVYDAAYNAQIVVDEKRGLIVSSDVARENHDYGQLPKQVEQSCEALNKQCERVVAESGYHRRAEVKAVDDQGIMVVVPSSLQAAENGPPAFWKRAFCYDKDHDCFTCPEGHRLDPRSTDRKRGRKKYMISDGKICQRCQHFGVCTRSRRGRWVCRFFDEDQIEKIAQQYDANQDLYRLRKQKAELPFAHLRHNFRVNSFLLRGLVGVKAEMALLANAFNLTRMINILGVRPLIAKLAV